MSFIRDPKVLREYPAFEIIEAAEAGVRVRVALKSPRAVSSFDDFGAAAYMAGEVESPDGKIESVYAFLIHSEGVRLLPMSPRPLKSALVEGRFSDYAPYVGFSLQDATVREQGA